MGQRTGSGDWRYNSRDWRTMRRAALARAGGRCQRCGKGAGKLTAHHKRPVKQGGPFWAMSNVEVLCWSCHQKEHPRKPAKPRPVTHNKVDAEWNAYITDLVRRARR